MHASMTSDREGIRLAVVQPHARPAPQAELAVTDAVGHVADAAAAGAELVLFPEGYPGPLRVESSFDATAALAAAAREHGCAVCWSRIERGEDGLHRKVAYVHGADGEQALRYVRAHPATGDVHPVLSGTALAAGGELGLAEVAGVRIGVLICSELWIPEVSRVLALRGAELLLAPAGGGFSEVAENWQLVARVRAIENNCYAAMTQNLFGEEDGSAVIAGPEGLVADGPRDAIVVGDVDLARVRWMRATDDSMVKPKPFRALPGQLRARRPELYGELAQPREGLYDYAAAGRLGTAAPVPASASGRVEETA
jgi:5-aminopentanamidase